MPYCRIGMSRLLMMHFHFSIRISPTRCLLSRSTGRKFPSQNTVSNTSSNVKQARNLNLYVSTQSHIRRVMPNPHPRHRAQLVYLICILHWFFVLDTLAPHKQDFPSNVIFIVKWKLGPLGTPYVRSRNVCVWVRVYVTVSVHTPRVCACVLMCVREKEAPQIQGTEDLHSDFRAWWRRRRERRKLTRILKAQRTFPKVYWLMLLLLLRTK